MHLLALTFASAIGFHENTENGHAIERLLRDINTIMLPTVEKF